jgi:hypothetical protein
MEEKRGEGELEPKRSLRAWVHLLLPDARMRVATGRMPRDWFEFLTKIPIVERLVIKRFVENLMCDQWVQEPHQDLDGLDPATATRQAHGRVLLEGLLVRMSQYREKTPRELRRIRKRLGM